MQTVASVYSSLSHSFSLTFSARISDFLFAILVQTSHMG